MFLRKEVQVEGEPVTELEGKRRSACKIEAVEQTPVAEVAQCCFGWGGDHFAVPRPMVMTGHGIVLC
jgi:hypothetical protein